MTKEKSKKYPEGHFLGMWMGIGIAIFSAIGIPLSFATENPGFIGIGPALGVAFGVAIGTSIESKYKKEGKIRPLTKDEIKKKKKYVSTVIVILTLFSIIGIAIFLLR
ncbi:hypothetical protein ACFLQ6_05580 [Thermoproteota archaeon]